MVRSVGLSLLCVISLGCAAPRVERVPEPIAGLSGWNDSAVSIAAIVIDLETGERIVERDAARLLRPASTQKLLTTAAMCRRHPDGRFSTQLAVEGGVATLLGGGDPLLSYTDLLELARTAQQAGVAAVHAVHVVDPLFDAPRFGEGWMWDDEPSAFMPAISGVPVDGGCVTVQVNEGPGGLAAALLPVDGGLRLQVTSSDERLSVDRGRYRAADVVTVVGRVRAGHTEERRITVPDPAAYTGWALAAALETAGLLDRSHLASAPPLVRGPSPDDAGLPVVATIERSIAEVLLRTNKDSDNLCAELLLRRLAGAELSLADGLAALDEDCAALGLDPSSYRLADGSGVSHYTLVSAELLLRTLVQIHATGGAIEALFRESLPIAGVDGTLSNRMRATAAEGRVRAKTGTISGVSNLAGYIDTQSGRKLAFVILVQNFVGSAARWRALQDEFCAALAAS